LDIDILCHCHGYKYWKRITQCKCLPRSMALHYVFFCTYKCATEMETQGVRFWNCSLRILCYIIGGKLILNIVLDMEITYSYVGY
jgi:hypothetical protein